ncbi:MAG TPA: fibrobacter succinogenes major paralogous domain-containing protein [Ignavibacteriaceae bacterium]|nr:fibrobacter succinogenes major paralogous domain-containing protein [Ignavibacteriaceae bacterium]
MKNKIILIIVLLNFLAMAQNKIMTLYYPDSTKVINISTLDSISIFICGTSKVNYAGKDYNTVLIGTQCWLKENLNVGTRINGSPNMSNNGILEKYCYNNDTTYCDTYGGLYTWNEAMQYETTEGAKGICPTGWHIPTRSDFSTLITTVDSSANALKKVGQGTGQGQGTNSSGFSALLGGGKVYDGSGFAHLNLYSFLYSSYSYPCSGSTCGYTLELKGDVSKVVGGTGGLATWGFGVRCIKN